MTSQIQIGVRRSPMYTLPKNSEVHGLSCKGQISGASFEQAAVSLGSTTASD